MMSALAIPKSIGRPTNTNGKNTVSLAPIFAGLLLVVMATAPGCDREDSVDPLPSRALGVVIKSIAPGF